MLSKQKLTIGLVVWVIFMFVFTLWMQTMKQTEQESEKPPQNITVSSSEWPTPPDFTKFVDVKEKKRTFFNYLYPMIVQVNTKLQKVRNELVALKQQPNLSAEQGRRVNQLAEEYKVDENLDIRYKLDALLIKIDTLPPSLVLAQGANESSWGTSRFARKANNYFGQWCFKKGCGLVPKRRADEAFHEVAKFDSVYESVESYMRNLNRHPAYSELRQIRSELRKQNNYISGQALAHGLEKYSERGEEYIAEINQMIRFNKLESLYPSASLSSMSE